MYEEEVLAAIDRLPPSFLECRANRHDWEGWNDYRQIDSRRDHNHRLRQGYSQYVERTLVCTLCGKKRSDAFLIVAQRGRVTLRKLGSPSYTDPPGFKISHAGDLPGMREYVMGAAYIRAMKGQS